MGFYNTSLSDPLGEWKCIKRDRSILKPITMQWTEFTSELSVVVA